MSLEAILSLYTLHSVLRVCDSNESHKRGIYSYLTALLS